MTVTLRSGRELEEGRVEKKDTEEENYAEIGEEFKQHNSETKRRETDKDAARATSKKRDSREKERG